MGNTLSTLTTGNVVILVSLTSNTVNGFTHTLRNRHDNNHKDCSLFELDTECGYGYKCINKHCVPSYHSVRKLLSRHRGKHFGEFKGKTVLRRIYDDPDFPKFVVLDTDQETLEFYREEHELVDESTVGPDIIRANGHTIRLTPVLEGKYTGEHDSGKRVGKGIMEYANGNVYDGDWNDDKMKGTGTMRYANGNKYNGDWRNNKMEGKGTMEYANGDKYNGDWRNNEIFQGTMTYVDGKSYEGKWVNGKWSYGTLRNAEGNIVYEGPWKNGKPKSGKLGDVCKDFNGNIDIECEEPATCYHECYWRNSYCVQWVDWGESCNDNEYKYCKRGQWPRERSCRGLCLQKEGSIPQHEICRHSSECESTNVWRKTPSCTYDHSQYHRQPICSMVSY